MAGKAPPHASDEKLIALYERWRALIDEHGELAGVPVAEETDALDRKRERLISDADKIGGQIVSLPATTRRGLLIKIEIMRDALSMPTKGHRSEWHQHERTVADGLDAMVDDVDRIRVPGTSEAADDPLVTLWAMWRLAGVLGSPKILTGEHSDDYGSGQVQQTGAIEDQLMEKPATTLIGPSSANRIAATQYANDDQATIVGRIALIQCGGYKPLVLVLDRFQKHPRRDHVV